MNPFFYLIFTIIIEFIVYIIAIRKNIMLLFAYCLLINLVSWPLANLFYGVSGLFWIIEICVFTIESILIKYLVNINWKKAIIISFIANLITAILGGLIQNNFRI
jgi:hypothetical protein